MRYPGNSRLGVPAKKHSLLRSSLDPASQRGVTCSHTAPDAVSMKSSGRRVRKIHFLLRPSLDLASQRGVTCGHTASRCGIQEKLERESPQDTFPFASLSGPRVAARGDALGHTAPRCGIQEKFGRESPQNTFPFTSLSGPRVAARGDVQSYRTLMRYPSDMQCGGMRLSVLPVVLDVQTGGESRKSGKSQYICPP